MRNYRALFLLLALLLAAGARPVHSQAVAPPPALRLEPTAPMRDTAGHLQRLDDPGGTLDAAQAGQSPGWTSLPGNLSAGFTSAAIWLRLRIDASRPGQWMLLLGNPLLDDVRVYTEQPSGGWRLLDHSGEDVPRHQWPTDFRSPAVQLGLLQAGEQTLLVRLATRNAFKTKLELWQRLAFDNHTRREGLFFGLYFGFYLLLICLHAFFWGATRAPMSGLFLAYLGTTVFNEALSLGLVQQITDLPAAWSDRVLGIGVALSLPIAVQVAARQLELARMLPRTTKALLRLVWGLGLAACLPVAAGRYAWGVAPVQLLSIPMAVLLIALALRLLRRGHRPARFFLAAFGAFYASVLVAYARNLGYLPLNDFTEHISALGTMLHMVLLSLWLLGQHERRRRAHERQQVYLQAELAQREQSESELRAALELERRVRQEQRDFVAMVSHELRTPLAIITTSAQQLARNLGAPPNKTLARSRNIREAAQRLLALMDDCLAEDRMAEPHAEPRLTPCDLHALIEELCQDFAPGRIVCARGEGTRHLNTDLALLRIALRNLLANADRHAPGHQAVQIDLQRDGERLRIDIANTSGPIPPEEQALLFERYYRGRSARAHPGAGLGLYLVRRIACKLGGSVALVTAGGDQPVCLRLELPL